MGFSLVEMLFVSSIGVILLAISVPEFLAGLDDMRTAAAARYVSGQLYLTRAEAVKRSVKVAFRFAPEGNDYRFGAFLDGNRNGVRTAEIASGVDPRLAEDVPLSARFGGVRFGILPSVPLIDGGFSADPIRLSSGSLLTFSPDGTATSGTLYIRGARNAQYAVRVFGVTGRTRVFKFLGAAGRWKPL